MVKVSELLFAEQIHTLCLILFTTSLLFCFLLIKLNSFTFISRRANADLKAIQSSHTVAVSRIGGLAIFFNLLLLAPLTFIFEINLEGLLWLTASSIPIFLAGFMEDLGYRVSPGKRLIAACLSGFIVILIFNLWISRLNIPMVDNMLQLAPIGIAFTIFATVGVSHAFNLIDGLNGFSSYVSISIALSLSLIAANGNEREIPLYMYMIISIVLGFLVLNFPNGKIFLGDAGAYTLGHILVWSAILLVNFDKSINPFSVLLVFFWPVADTVLAIWRRWKLGARAYLPDRLHFHQLTMRYLEIRVLGKRNRGISNPLATFVLAPFVTAPQILGILFARNSAMSYWSVFLVTILFIFTYTLMVKSANRTKV